MNGWELSNAMELLARADQDAIREFSRNYSLAATNPEASALVVIRKYDTKQDIEPQVQPPGASGLGKGFRVGLAVITSKGEHVFQLPTLRTYLSLSLLGNPLDGNDKIVIETDLGEALTSLATLESSLPKMSAGLLDEEVLEAAIVSIE
ncbi:MAG: hypothetical protein ACI80K_004524 [Paracoccaceae bacterium]|jgi:hypothetical protein